MLVKWLQKQKGEGAVCQGLSPTLSLRNSVTESQHLESRQDKVFMVFFEKPAFCMFGKESSARLHDEAVVLRWSCHIQILCSRCFGCDHMGLILCPRRYEIIP